MLFAAVHRVEIVAPLRRSWRRKIMSEHRVAISQRLVSEDV